MTTPHLNAKYTWHNIITALLLYHASQPHLYFSRDPYPHHLKISMQSYKHKYKSGVQQKAIGVHFLDLPLVKVKPTCKKTGYKERRPAVLHLHALITGTFTIYPNLHQESPNSVGKCWRKPHSTLVLQETLDILGLRSSMPKKRQFPSKAQIPSFHLNCRGQRWKCSEDS